MKLHQKGFLLVELNKVCSLWDHDLVDIALREYGLSGLYSSNSLFVALDELAAAGLIERIESRLDTNSINANSDRVMFNCRLTDFGRARMRDTGLLSSDRGLCE